MKSLAIILKLSLPAVAAAAAAWGGPTLFDPSTTYIPKIKRTKSIQTTRFGTQTFGEAAPCYEIMSSQDQFQIRLHLNPPKFPICHHGDDMHRMVAASHARPKSLSDMVHVKFFANTLTVSGKGSFQPASRFSQDFSFQNPSEVDIQNAHVHVEKTGLVTITVPWRSFAGARALAPSLAEVMAEDVAVKRDAEPAPAQRVVAAKKKPAFTAPPLQEIEPKQPAFAAAPRTVRKQRVAAKHGENKREKPVVQPVIDASSEMLDSLWEHALEDIPAVSQSMASPESVEMTRDEPTVASLKTAMEASLEDLDRLWEGTLQSSWPSLLEYPREEKDDYHKPVDGVDAKANKIDMGIAKSIDAMGDAIYQQVEEEENKQYDPMDLEVENLLSDVETMLADMDGEKKEEELEPVSWPTLLEMNESSDDVALEPTDMDVESLMATIGDVVFQQEESIEQKDASVFEQMG